MRYIFMVLSNGFRCEGNLTTLATTLSSGQLPTKHIFPYGRLIYSLSPWRAISLSQGWVVLRLLWGVGVAFSESFFTEATAFLDSFLARRTAFSGSSYMKG